MTTQLKDELNQIIGRDLTALELAKVESACLRHDFMRKPFISAPLNKVPEFANYECGNGACRWVGRERDVLVIEGIKCCPKCDHAVRTIAATA